LLSHSFNFPIKKLMIMLPLHGQSTAALQQRQWADLTFQKNLKEMFLLNSQY